MNRSLHYGIGAALCMVALLSHADDEYFVSVATPQVLHKTIPPDTKYYFGTGWHKESGYDARKAAEQACEKEAGEENAGQSRARCKAAAFRLVLGTWIDKGDEQSKSTFFAETSSLGQSPRGEASKRFLQNVDSCGQI